MDQKPSSLPSSPRLPRRKPLPHSSSSLRWQSESRQQRLSSLYSYNLHPSSLSSLSSLHLSSVMNQRPSTSSSSQAAPATNQQSSASSCSQPSPATIQQPSTSSSWQSSPATNPQPSTSSSSQRLQTFRDRSCIQPALLNLTRMLGQAKKVYVPNLNFSRNFQTKMEPEDDPIPIEVTKEPGKKENRRERPGRKLIEGAETFAPDMKPQIVGRGAGACKQEIDERAVKNIFNENLSKKFEGDRQDMPVSIPHLLDMDDALKAEKNYVGAETPLYSLKNLIKNGGTDSPLYLLKTPRFMPALLDDSESPSTSADKKDTKKGCSIHDLLPGQIGKLQVLKSGKLKLVLGNCEFVLHQGINVNIREELAHVVTDSETESSHIVSLGVIKERILAVPDVIAR